MSIGLCVPASAGAWGFQSGTPTPVPASPEQDIDFTAAGDIWFASPSSRGVYRINPTGTLLQTIPSQWVPHAVAVNRGNGDVLAVAGDGPGNGPPDAVYVYGADGTFLRAFGGELSGGGTRLRRVAVNSVTGHVYLASEAQLGEYDQLGAFVGAINVPGIADVEVEPATGDVLIATGPTIVRYSATLGGPQPVLTAPGNRPILGLGTGLNGTLWTNTNDCVVRQFASSTQVLRSVDVGCASYTSFYGLEADLRNGAYVMNAGGAMFYAATDPPRASFTASPDGPVHRGQHVDFASTSSDSDGTIASTRWDLNDDGDYGDAVGVTAGTTFDALGDHAVRMRIVDDEGGTATRTLVIHVDDRAPVASFATSPSTPETGDTVTLTSTSSDPDGTIAQTEWDLDDNGTFEASGGEVTTSFATGGDHVVHIRVTDDAGNVVTAQRTITVAAPGQALPRLSVADASVTEGGRGTTTYLQFPVTLSTAGAGPVSVTYETTPGSAADGVDYASRSQSTLTFAPGQTEKTVRVPVYGDDVDEPDETVGLALSDPSGATIARAAADGVIHDDDEPGTTTTTTTTTTTPTTTTTTVAPVTTVIVTPPPPTPPTATPEPPAPTPTRIHVVLTGDGAGSVTGLPSPCADVCNGTFADAAPVTLVARAAPGARFVGFTGCDSTAGTSCVVTPSAEGVGVTASFAVRPRQLVVDKEGQGAATVASADGGIACGTDCTSSYRSGARVRLTASPDAITRFVRWRNCVPSTAPSCVATVSNAGTGVALVLQRKTTALSLKVLGAGRGTVGVGGLDQPLECSSTCNRELPAGEDYTLHPAAADGSAFTGWHNCDEPHGSDCVLHADGRPARVEATFQRLAPVTINVTGDGRGSIEVQGEHAQTCPSDCVVPSVSGDEIVLTPHVRSGVFSGWPAGTCTRRVDDACIIAVRDPITTTADFHKTRLTRVTVQFAGATEPEDGQPDLGRHVDFTANLGFALGQQCFAGATGRCTIDLAPGLYTVDATASATHALTTVGALTGGCTQPGLDDRSCVLSVGDAPRTITATYTSKSTPVTVRFEGPAEPDDGRPELGRHVVFTAVDSPGSTAADCYAGTTGECTVPVPRGAYIADAAATSAGAVTATTGSLTTGCSARDVPGVGCPVQVGARPLTLTARYRSRVTPVRIHFDGATEPSDGQANLGRLVRLVDMDGLSRAGECLAGTTGTCEVSVPRGLYRLDPDVRSPSGSSTKGTITSGCTVPDVGTGSCYLAVGDDPADVHVLFTSVATSTVRVHFEGQRDGFDGQPGLGRSVRLLQEPELPGNVDVSCAAGTGDTCELRVPPGTYLAQARVDAPPGTPAATDGSVHGACVGPRTGAHQCYVHVGNGVVDLTARYTATHRALTVAFAGGDGAARVPEFGLTCRSDAPCSKPVPVGARVVIETTPDPGAANPFSGWSGCDALVDRAGPTPVCAFTMPDADRTVTLNYAPRAGQVEVSFEGGAGDRRVSFPAPFNRPACSAAEAATCTRSFEVGQAPTLVAESPPAVDGVAYRFEGWRGCGPGDGLQRTATCTLSPLPAATRRVTARFGPVLARLHLRVEGTDGQRESVLGTGAADFACRASVIATGGCDRDVVRPALIGLTPQQAPTSQLRFKGWRAPCLAPGAVRAFVDVVNAARNGPTVPGTSVLQFGATGAGAGLDAAHVNRDTCYLGLDAETTVTAIWERPPGAPADPPTRPLSVRLTGGDGTRRVRFTAPSADAPDCLATGAADQTCTSGFDDGDNVRLEATPSATSRFKRWEGCLSPTTSCTVKAGAVRKVTAVFQTKTLPVHLHIAGGQGTRRLRAATDASAADLSRLGGGLLPPDLLARFPVVCRAPDDDPCTQTRDRNQPLVIVAEHAPDADAQFDHWSVPACGLGAVCVIRAEDADGLTAVFEPRFAPLTVAISGGAGSRSIALTAPGSDADQTRACTASGADGAECARSFTAATPVTLTASAGANADAAFDHWAGACPTPDGIPAPPTCTVPAGAVARVTAVYRTVRHTLRIAFSGGDGERLVAVSGGTTCSSSGPECTRELAPGQTIELEQRQVKSANASPLGISGCLPVPLTSRCRLVMPSSDLTVMARWRIGVFTAHIRFAGASGSHSVEVTPQLGGTRPRCAVVHDGGLAGCDVRFTLGDVGLNLQAGGDTPADGAEFDHWEGCPESTSPIPSRTCSVLPTRAEQTVTAHYRRTTRPLRILMSGGDGGRTVHVVAGDVPNCSDTCTRDVSIAGATLEASAAADRDSRFDHWTGCVPVIGTPRCLVAASTDAVTAVYTRRWTRVRVRVVGGEGDRVVSVTGAPACHSRDGSVCERTFRNRGDAPDVVTLSTPAGGSNVLLGISGCPTPSAGPLCSFPAPWGRDVEVTARFASASAHVSVEMTNGTYGKMTFGPGDQCQGPCGRDVRTLQTVVATATGRNGGLFRSWEACPGVAIGSVCTFVAQPGENRIRAKFLGG